MPARPHARRARLVLPALPLAVAVTVALLPAAYGAALPGDAAAQSRGVRVDYERAVERAQEQAREAVERAEEYAREAQREGLLAELDYDLEWPTIAFIGSEFGSTREIVKNAPYTADAITESIQVLQDGNRIVKRNSTKLARDTYGRTRQEKEGPRGSVVYIFDPIENRNYALNPQKRSAVRIPRVPAIPVPPMTLVEPGATLLAATSPTPPTPVTPMTPMSPMTPAVPPTLRAAPPPPVPPTPPAPPSPGIGGTETERVFVRRGDGTSRSDDVRVEVIRIAGHDASTGVPAPPLPPIAMPLVPHGKGERRNLGTRDFDGVKAEGTQTTHTIAAGEIGNEKPIVITSERWFAPELQLVVFARTSDPRAGDTIYRLANLRRGEPAAELFRVPPDYQKRDWRG